jgi:hypothetical protein
MLAATPSVQPVSAAFFPPVGGGLNRRSAFAVLNGGRHRRRLNGGGAAPLKCDNDEDRETPLRVPKTADTMLKVITSRATRSVVVEGVEASKSKSLTGLVLVEAPAIALERVPVDFVVMADTSGSMQGSKMKQVINSLTWMADNLTDNDRVCVIDFESAANLLMPLTFMTATGKAALREAAAHMTALL